MIAHTSSQKRLYKVLSFVVLGTSEDFLHLTNVVYEIMSMCTCVKQQTDYLYAAYPDSKLTSNQRRIDVSRGVEPTLISDVDPVSFCSSG